MSNEQFSFASKNKFTAGELSPTLEGRSDLKMQQNGLKKMLNFMVLPSGAATRRPGTVYANHFDKNKPRSLFNHVINRELQFIIVIADTTVIDPNDPYKEIEKKDRAVNVSVMINNETIDESIDELKGIVLDPAKFRSITIQGTTYVNFGDNQPIYTFKLELSPNKEMKPSFEKFKVDGKRYKDNKTYQSIFRDTVREDDKKLNEELKKQEADTYTELSGTVVTIFEGRLWLFGCAENTHLITASGMGKFDDFDISYKSLVQARSPLSAFSVSFVSDTLDAVIWAKPLGDTLLVATTDGIYILKTGDRTKDQFVKIHKEVDKAISPIAPVILGKTVFFVDGDCRQIHSMSYSSEKGGYLVSSVTQYAEHLFTTPIMKIIAVNSPFPMLFVQMSDGSLNIFTYIEDSKAMGWSQHYLGGSGTISDMCLFQSVGQEDVYLKVSRPGTAYRRVEEARLSSCEYGLDTAIFLLQSATGTQKADLLKSKLKHEQEIKELKVLLQQEDNTIVHDIQGFVRKPLAITREFVEYIECKHLTGKTNRSIHDPVYVDCSMDYKRDEQRELDAAYERAMEAGANFNFKEDLSELEVLVNKQIDMDMQFDLTDEEIRTQFKVENIRISEMNTIAKEEEGTLESGINLLDVESIWIKFIREYFVKYQKDLLLISALKTSMVRQIEKIQTYTMNILLGNFENSELLNTLFTNVIYIDHELVNKVNLMDEWEENETTKKIYYIAHENINRYSFSSFAQKQVNDIDTDEFKELKEFLLILKGIGELYQNTHDVFVKNKKTKLMRNFIKLTNSNWLNMNIQNNVNNLVLREILAKKVKTEEISANNYNSFISNIDLLDIKNHVLDTCNPQGNFIKCFKIKKGRMEHNYANKVAKYNEETNVDLNASVDSFGELGEGIMHGVGEINNALLDLTREDIEGYFQSEIILMLAKLYNKYGAIVLDANISELKELTTSIFESFLKFNATLDYKIQEFLLTSDEGKTPLFKLVDDLLNNYKDNKKSEERISVIKLARQRKIDEYLKHIEEGGELPDEIDEGFQEDLKDKYEEIQEMKEFEREYGLYQSKLKYLKYCKTEVAFETKYKDLSNKDLSNKVQQALLEKWKEITAGETPDNADFEVSIFGQEVVDNCKKIDEVYISDSDLLIWNILAKTYPDDIENFMAYSEELKKAKNIESNLKHIDNDYYCLLSYSLLSLKVTINKIYTELVQRIDSVLPHEKKFLANYIEDTTNPSKVDKFLFLNKDYFPIFRMNFPDIDMHTIKNLTTQMDSTIHTIDTDMYDVGKRYGGTEISIIGDEEEILRYPFYYKDISQYYIPLNMNCRFVSLGFPYRSVFQTFPIIFPEEADNMLKIDTSLSIKFFNTKGGYIEEKTSRGNYKKQYINAPVSQLDGVERYMGEKQYLIAEALQSIQTPYTSGWVNFSYNRAISHDIDVMFAVDEPYPVTILKIVAKAKLVPHAIK